ncbi:exoribonuclease family protein [Piedraia hortae CBS 480.64]|uniref:Ribosomal RNA-processing protein 41 n=1 Tax=Piedraia hortae CBS 480.64 TaxID=1314780 RepID=A0A6A7BUQ5_9PEZI|nr:exoribonuclease family protein [Piedraia hortae CBS 480.64]
MPGLDSSSYPLGHLRVDGRRWNELRQTNGQLGTQPVADGSCLFSMGNTIVLCTINGPRELRRSGGRDPSSEARLEVELDLPAFSGTDRKKSIKNDKRITEMAHTISSAFSKTLFLHLYPHSTITIALHVLSQDGSLLATCINAASLALIDAGIPTTDIVAACTTGSTAAYADREEEADPLLDLNNLEEQELPFLTMATGGGASESINTLVMETRIQLNRLDAMMSVCLNGCTQIRRLLNEIIKVHGKRVLDAKVS